MKEKPIIFSAPMVQAILAGRKTQTRRVIKPQPEIHESIWPAGVECHWYSPTVIRRGIEEPGPEIFGFANEDEGWKCPYGAPGDRLWVKENFYFDLLPWANGGSLDSVPIEERNALSLYYPADANNSRWCCELIPECCCAEVGKPKIRPSIHMPRWASRITLEVTEVRVQRVQEISEEDAVAEGCERVDDYYSAKFAVPGPLYRFEHLWGSINGKKPGFTWADNCWVWAISFRKI